MHRKDTSSRPAAGKPRLLTKASSVALLQEPLVSSPRDWDSAAESVEPFPADDKPSDTASMAVDISLRRGRIALITIATVTVIVAVVRFFTNGYEIRQYEKTELDVNQQKRILDDYNSYSGNIVSAFSKPIEIFVAACAQVIVLRFVSASLLRNEPSWKAVYGALALSAGVGYLINNGFNSLNVQLVDLDIVSVVKPSDLSSSDTVVPSYTDGTSRVTNVSSSVSETQWRNPITNTVLRNVVQSQAVRSKSVCTPSEYISMFKPIILDTVEYGFPQRDWMKQLLPEALPVTSLQFVLNPTNKSANVGVNSEDLPMNASIASNLVLSAMLLSNDFIPIDRSIKDPSYDENIGSATEVKRNTSTAVRAKLLPPDYETASDADQKKWFLSRINSFLTTSFNRTSNMTMTNIPMKFEHVDIAPDIVFDAVTFEIDVDPRRLADITNTKTGDRYMQEGGDYTSFEYFGFTCGPWPARCLFKKRDPSVNSWTVNAGDVYYDAPAQIQAFSICLNDNGTELMQTSVFEKQNLNVLPCNRTSTTSMLLLSVGKRILADALSENVTANTTGVFPSSMYNSATNLRKIYSYAVGRLSWKTTDLADEFGATCDVSSGNKCQGLALELNETSVGATPQRLVVSADAIPMDALLQPQLNNVDLDNAFRQRPLTLVQVHEPTKQLNPIGWYDVVAGDLLLPHNVRNLSWDQSKSDWRYMCVVVEERFQRVLDNHMYIEHPLQATYTAATFFLFQDAVVKDVVASNNQSALSKTMLAFDGNNQKVSLSVSIPRMNSLLTQIGCAVLLVGVAASILWATVVRNSPSRTNELMGITNAEVIVRAKLDEKTFPSLLLHRHVMSIHGATRERQRLDGYVVDSLTFQQRDTQQESRRDRPTEDGEVSV